MHGNRMPGAGISGYAIGDGGERNQGRKQAVYPPDPQPIRAI